MKTAVSVPDDVFDKAERLARRAGRSRSDVLELGLTRLDAKRKLSQNRSEADIDGVIEALGDASPAERQVAADMRRTTRAP